MTPPRPYHRLVDPDEVAVPERGSLDDRADGTPVLRGHRRRPVNDRVSPTPVPPGRRDRARRPPLEGRLLRAVRRGRPPPRTPDRSAGHHRSGRLHPDRVHQRPTAKRSAITGCTGVEDRSTDTSGCRASSDHPGPEADPTRGSVVSDFTANIDLISTLCHDPRRRPAGHGRRSLAARLPHRRHASQPATMCGPTCRGTTTCVHRSEHRSADGPSTGASP